MTSSAMIDVEKQMQAIYLIRANKALFNYNKWKGSNCLGSNKKATVTLKDIIFFINMSHDFAYANLFSMDPSEQIKWNANFIKILSK